ncbi:MAG: hypothetical protein IJ463_04305 [Bacilli bacterium]|nr:hypothetical protein [Bacilli bacterium]
MNLDLNIYTILETRYKKTQFLPKHWDKIEDIKIKIELLSEALNKNKSIEELSLYTKLIGEDKNV